jgi:hypothetical protein
LVQSLRLEPGPGDSTIGAWGLRLEAWEIKQ